MAKSKMKKLILYLVGLFIVFSSTAQETKSELKTRFDVIRNETVAGANTKTRIANAYQESADGSIGVYPVSASGTDTYTGTLLGLDAYSGRIVFVVFANNNTGASTLNLSPVGIAANIQKYDGGWMALEADDIVAGVLYRLYHDGTRFQLDLGGSGAGLVDADYGDITVSGVGTVMTIDNGVVTGGKIASSVALAGNPTTTTQSANTNNTTISTTAYADGKVADAINNATTTIAPSQNAVHDALGLIETTERTNDYTLDLGVDEFRTIPINAATTKTVIVPLNSSEAFSIGTVIGIKWQTGAVGQPAVSAAGGVTINTTAGNLLVPVVNSTSYLIKTGTDTWSFLNGTPGIVAAALTKSDDTNVTLTLSGTPTTALLQATSLTLGWTGDLAFSRFTQGSALSVLGVTGNSTADHASIAAGTDGHILRRSGTTLSFGSIKSNFINGTATNDAATAGNIGEEVSSTISTYTNYTTTATYQNITSITLTAGDWDLSAFVTYSSNSATITAAANAIFVISTTTASAAGSTEGLNIAYVPQAALLGTSFFSDSISPYRVSISGTTTYYLNSQATFTLGNPQFTGTIRARRIR